MFPVNPQPPHPSPCTCLASNQTPYFQAPHIRMVTSRPMFWGRATSPKNHTLHSISSGAHLITRGPPLILPWSWTPTFWPAVGAQLAAIPRAWHMEHSTWHREIGKDCQALAARANLGKFHFSPAPDRQIWWSSVIAVSSFPKQVTRIASHRVESPWSSDRAWLAPCHATGLGAVLSIPICNACTTSIVPTMHYSPFGRRE